MAEFTTSKNNPDLHSSREQKFHKICIITPVLNGTKYLRTCIESVLDQDYPNTEHIFIDGGSTDGTLELLASYKEQFPQQITIINAPRVGPEKSWNIGLKHVKGDVIGWLGADDLLVPGALQTVVDFFKSHPEAYFVFGACETINEKDELIRSSVPQDFNLNTALNDICHIPTTSAFYRRDVIEKVGYLDDSFHCCDFDFWLRAGKQFRLFRINPVLSRARLHSGSTSGILGKKVYPRECYAISRKHGGHLVSGYAIKYLGSVVIESLRPVFGRLYPVFSPFMKEKVYPASVRIVNVFHCRK